jgi:hypothetical protein
MIDLISRNKVPYEFIIGQPRVYPTATQGAGAALLSGAAWAWGNLGTIVPINTITAEFIVQTFVIESCDQNGVFEIEFYYGAGPTLFATYRFAIAGGFFGNPTATRLSSPVIPANSQIQARVATSAVATNLTISIGYIFT